MKVVDTIWFTTCRQELLGIVIGYDEITKEPKAYIGIGDGRDEADDVLNINHLGSKVNLDAIKKLHNHFFPPEGT